MCKIFNSMTLLIHFSISANFSAVTDWSHNIYYYIPLVPMGSKGNTENTFQ